MAAIKQGLFIFFWVISLAGVGVVSYFFVTEASHGRGAKVIDHNKVVKAWTDTHRSEFLQFSLNLTKIEYGASLSSSKSLINATCGGVSPNNEWALKDQHHTQLSAYDSLFYRCTFPYTQLPSTLTDAFSAWGTDYKIIASGGAELVHQGTSIAELTPIVSTGSDQLSCNSVGGYFKSDTTACYSCNRLASMCWKVKLHSSGNYWEIDSSYGGDGCDYNQATWNVETFSSVCNPSIFEVIVRHVDDPHIYAAHQTGGSMDYGENSSRYNIWAIVALVVASFAIIATVTFILVEFHSCCSQYTACATDDNDAAAAKKDVHPDDAINDLGIDYEAKHDNPELELDTFSSPNFTPHPVEVLRQPSSPPESSSRLHRAHTAEDCIFDDIDSFE